MSHTRQSDWHGDLSLSEAPAYGPESPRPPPAKAHCLRVSQWPPRHAQFAASVVLRLCVATLPGAAWSRDGRRSVSGALRPQAQAVSRAH